MMLLKRNFILFKMQPDRVLLMAASTTTLLAIPEFKQIYTLHH